MPLPTVIPPPRPGGGPPLPGRPTGGRLWLSLLAERPPRPILLAALTALPAVRMAFPSPPPGPTCITPTFGPAPVWDQIDNKGAENQREACHMRDHESQLTSKAASRVRREHQRRQRLLVQIM